AGSSAAKVGAAAVVTGVIAGGAAVGVPSNHDSQRSAVAGNRPTEQAAPASRPQVVKLQEAPRAAAPKAPAPQTASRPKGSDHTQQGAVQEPATTVRPASSGDGGDKHSGDQEKRPAGSHKKDNSGPSGGDQGEHVAVT